jgi:TRAP-type C4-dicarboxylate transport system permease small subunit
MHGIGEAYAAVVRRLATFLMYVAGFAVMFMVVITTAEIILRRFRITIPGTYDLVQIAGAIAVACALPYTTAVKGHVAIELVYLKLGRTGRIIVDSLTRVLSIVFFCLLAWKCFDYGVDMKQRGLVSMTLQVPMFWIPWLVAVSCVVVVLVKIHLLFHPGKEMIKP